MPTGAAEGSDEMPSRPKSEAMRSASRSRPRFAQALKRAKDRSQAAAHRTDEVAVALEVREHVAVAESPAPRERRSARIGGRRPVEARKGAAARQHGAPRRAARVEGGTHGGAYVLEVDDALEL